MSDLFTYPGNFQARETLHIEQTTVVTKNSSFDLNLTFKRKNIYTLIAATVPSLATFKHKGLLILSGQHLYNDHASLANLKKKGFLTDQQFDSTFDHVTQKSIETIYFLGSTKVHLYQV